MYRSLDRAGVSTPTELMALGRGETVRRLVENWQGEERQIEQPPRTIACLAEFDAFVADGIVREERARAYDLRLRILRWLMHVR